MAGSMALSLEATTALAAGAVVALFVFSRAQRATLLPDGKVAREIHTLDSTHPILGNIIERLRNRHRSYDWMLEQSIRFNGEPWAIKIPGHPAMVILTMPDAIEEVTINQFQNFPKGDFQIERMLDMFGAGLIASDGARWLHQRKVAAKFFSTNVLRTIMMESMQANVKAVCAVIDGKMAGPDQRVDLKQLFLEFTLETFVEVGMGVELNCIGATDPHPFQHSLDVIAPITTRRFRVPSVIWKTQRWLNIGVEADMTKHKAIVREWLHGVIQQSLQRIAEKKSEGGIKSVVELFVEHSGDGTAGVQPDDLVDFLLTFVIAARDTTADTMCWLFYALSKNPRVMKILRAEMKAQLGSGEIPYLTTEHTKRLTYLEATLKETIRLYPAAPFTVRQAAKDTVICGDIVLKKHQLIGTPAYVLARLPQVWGPDATEFKPERWIDPVSGGIVQVPPTKFFSFSAGPRTCLGMGLAMLELRILAANLLHRYEFEIDPSNDGSYEAAPTLIMKHPLWAKASNFGG